MARVESVGRRFLAVTPSDTVPLSKGAADAFFVGVAGNIALKGEDGTSVVFPCPASYILPVGSGFVLATGTTATGIVALYG